MPDEQGRMTAEEIAEARAREGVYVFEFSNTDIAEMIRTHGLFPQDGDESGDDEDRQ